MKRSFACPATHWLPENFANTARTATAVKSSCKRHARGQTRCVVIVLALVFGLLIGGIMFGAAEFVTKALPLIPSIVAGAAVGIIIGAFLGLMQRGRERGNIGQNRTRTNSQAAQPAQGTRTVIAVRLANPDNISRKSKARAILINNKGKIDRSVGREV